MPKVLYIAGYGRSGSTILSIILGNHPELVSVSEVSLLPEDWASRRCSCGQAYPDCEFWGDFFPQAPTPTLIEQLRNIEKSNHLPRLVLAGTPDHYLDYQRRLLAHIQEKSGCEIIVDSSKSARYTAGRFYALRSVADVCVVHLVRDGLASLESLVVKGRNWQLEGVSQPEQISAARGAFGWMTANFWALVLGRRVPYMRLRYEDFLAEPAQHLHAIGEFAGFDPQPLIDKIEADDAFTVGHMVGGNRVRLAEKLQLRPPNPQPSQLTRRQRITFWLIAGWLQRGLGYH